jgi:hypothetical protein
MAVSRKRISETGEETRKTCHDCGIAAAFCVFSPTPDGDHTILHGGYGSRFDTRLFVGPARDTPTQRFPWLALLEKEEGRSEQPTGGFSLHLCDACICRQLPMSGMVDAGRFEPNRGPLELYEYWHNLQKNPEIKPVDVKEGDVIVGQLFPALHDGDGTPPPKDVLALVLRSFGDARILVSRLFAMEQIPSHYPVVRVAKKNSNHASTPMVDTLDRARSTLSSTFEMPADGLWSTPLIESVPIRCFDVCGSVPPASLEVARRNAAVLFLS